MILEAAQQKNCKPETLIFLNTDALFSYSLVT